MAELTAIAFTALPTAHDGYTVLYENETVCQSDSKLSDLVGDKIKNKLDTEIYANDSGTFLTAHQDISNKLDATAFSTVSGTFLTAHQNLDEYATIVWVKEQGYISAHQPISADEWNSCYDTVCANSGTWSSDWTDEIHAASANAFNEASAWVEEQNYITGVDLSNYYTKNETSSVNELTEEFNNKQYKLEFNYHNDTISGINNSGIYSDSWKLISENKNSKYCYDSSSGNLSVYIGQNNSAVSGDSYTLGRDNFTEQGVNIGYDNIIDVSSLEDIPGNFNIGKSNSAVGNPGAVNIGQRNSANSWGVNIGEENSASLGGYNLGTKNKTSHGSCSIGEANEATEGSYSIGKSNKTTGAGYTLGERNSAEGVSVAVGINNTATSASHTFGSNNLANFGAVSIGFGSTAENGSFTIGNLNISNKGSFAAGSNAKANNGSYAIGTNLSAENGGISIGDKITATNGSIALGIGGNNANKGSFILGNKNFAFAGTTTIGDDNTATYTDIIGNRNNINANILDDSATSAEQYTKIIGDPEDPDHETVQINIKNFVAGLENTATFAKNAYIFGNYNKITCSSLEDYLNPDNDGYTFIFGMMNSANRNYDMAIGYSAIASGGENIALGVPFESILGYRTVEEYGYSYIQTETGVIPTLAQGYKNIVVRGNISGIGNIAINSNITGEYALERTINNNITNSIVYSKSANYIANNIINNSNAIFSANYFNENKIINSQSLETTCNDFTCNNLFHANNITISAREQANDNTILHSKYLNIKSDTFCRNIITHCNYWNAASSAISAKTRINDNIISNTTLMNDNNISKISENILFNSVIDGTEAILDEWGSPTYERRETEQYITWANNCDITRNFIFGSHIGNYVYNTFSFADNSNTNPGGSQLRNTVRTFNFGDNDINKSINSFVFGDDNKISAISRSFIFGGYNKLSNNLTLDDDDYSDNIFVFGYNNTVIKDESKSGDPLLERNKILGIHNYIKAVDHINDNIIVGNNNSINYNITKPSKVRIVENVNYPNYPDSDSDLQSAAFATYRNNIFGNGIRVSQCITDSFIAGIGNYVFDSTERSASREASYNSIYSFGVANIAYDGSHQLNIGYNNETSGHFAEAIGDGILSNGQQLVIGKCNEATEGTNRYSIEYDSATDTIRNIAQSGIIFAIGNGTYDFASTENEYGNIIYYDKDKNEIYENDILNEEYVTRSNALTVSANGVVSASDYITSGNYKLSELNELVDLIRNKPLTGSYSIKCVNGTLTWVLDNI